MKKLCIDFKVNHTFVQPIAGIAAFPLRFFAACFKRNTATSPLTSCRQANTKSGFFRH